MFVVTVTYLKPLNEVDEYLASHREFLKLGYEMKLLLASGSQVPRTGGIILARGNDKKKLLDFLENDPFKVNNIASYEVVEFNPALFAPEMAELVK
ncbi:YciI family protein [Bdellovibrio sp.]|uniref:YciI family protein n=1 Tax=Bdellovibrio sp. TaxID=28201 RepID=UPI0039E2FDCA